MQQKHGITVWAIESKKLTKIEGRLGFANYRRRFKPK
jgi:hypothetical protein